MGYRIEFAAAGGVLRAIVSGGSAFAGAIARDIGEQVQRSSVRQVVIDLRRLQDRVGRLALLAAHCAPERVAVVDGQEYDHYYVFAEIAAKSAGRELRRFNDERAALDWLWRSPSSER
jgi:hypothetical protein